MKVIGYARLSNETEASTSIDRQRAAIADYAERRGWDLVGLEVDPFASATKTRLDRPGLTRARVAVERGDAEAVLVWRLDRISRSVVDFGTLIEGGVAVVSTAEDVDMTTPMGRAMAYILQIFAEMESAATSARVTSAVAHLRRVGKFPGGRVPYGYRTSPHPSGSGRVLEIDPDAAAEVRRWADGVLAGESLYSLVKGSSTSLETARGILVGEAVLGRVASKGDVLRDADGLPADVWPAILTVAESRELRAILARKGRGTSRRKASALLSGLLYCGSCNGVMYASAGHYRCVPAKGRTCVAPVRVKGDLVEAAVAAEFLASVGRLPYFEERVLASSPAELAEVEEAISATTTSLAEDGADVAALVERLTALKARRADLRARPSMPERTLVDTGHTFAEVWTDAETPARRTMLSSALDGATVSKAAAWSADRVALLWRPDHAVEDYDAV